MNMSEKRFTMIEEKLSENKIIIKVYDDGKELYLPDVVDLLNSQHETIERMKQEEQLYAKDILRLNEINKQTSDCTDILGGY